MTRKQKELVALLVAKGPLNVFDIASHFNVHHNGIRLRLAKLVASGEARIVETEGYLEVSTGRFIKRKGLAYAAL